MYQDVSLAFRRIITKLSHDAELIDLFFNNHLIMLYTARDSRPESLLFFRTNLEQKITMMEQFIQALLEQFEQPRTDLEKNLRALFAEWVERLDLVSRAELERQEMQLADARRTIAALSQRLDELEAAQQQNAP